MPYKQIIFEEFNIEDSEGRKDSLDKLKAFLVKIVGEEETGKLYSFCSVYRKEYDPYKYADIEEILRLTEKSLPSHFYFRWDNNDDETVYFSVEAMAFETEKELRDTIAAAGWFAERVRYIPSSNKILELT